MTNECEVLAHVVDKTRQLSLLYLGKLKDCDPYRTYQAEGVTLNSILWLKAHLAVTENWLLLRSTGGPSVKIPWARQFGLGSAIPAKEEYPPLDEVNAIFNEVHAASVAHVSSLPEEMLGQINTTGFEFAGENTIRSVIVHGIRHEGTHAGHLGWLCKLNGIKTI